MRKRNKEEKKGKKMKRSPMETFPLTPRGSLIAHGKRNGWINEECTQQQEDNSSR